MLIPLPQATELWSPVLRMANMPCCCAYISYPLGLIWYMRMALPWDPYNGSYQTDNAGAWALLVPLHAIEFFTGFSPAVEKRGFDDLKHEIQGKILLNREINILKVR